MNGTSKGLATLLTYSRHRGLPHANNPFPATSNPSIL